MSGLISGILGCVAIIIYILIGWFIQSLIQEDWDEPSLLLAILWPPLLVILGLCGLFVLVEKLAEKIKEKKDES